MAAKLKVFRYADGFHSWTVAASSRAKALAAWGVTRLTEATPDLAETDLRQLQDLVPQQLLSLAAAGLDSALRRSSCATSHCAKLAYQRAVPLPSRARRTSSATSTTSSRAATTASAT